MKMLKFGGKNLPEGTSTWYDLIRPEDGKYGGQIRAIPGDVVPADSVGKIIGSKPDGSDELMPNADYYVETGRASYVEADAAAGGSKKK